MKSLGHFWDDCLALFGHFLHTFENVPQPPGGPQVLFCASGQRLGGSPGPAGEVELSKILALGAAHRVCVTAPPQHNVPFATFYECPQADVSQAIRPGRWPKSTGIAFPTEAQKSGKAAPSP